MVKRFKGLFIISVILFSTAAGFAATKTWVGGDSSKPTDWDTAANWSPSGVPGTGDDVTINTPSNHPAITSAVVVKSLLIDYGCFLTLGTGATFTLSGDFTNHGTFTADANTTVIFNGDNSQIAGSANSGFYNLKINNGKKCTFHKDIEVANTLTNNGTLTAAVSDRVVIFTGNNCSITGSTETILENLTINSGKKLTVEQNITIRKNFNNNGTFDALTHSKTVTFNPPAGGAVTIKGSGDENDTKFHSIKCENAGGKTLKVEGKISVDELVLSGTSSPASYLRADSGTGAGTSGEIHLKAIHTGTGAYLNINTDKVKIQPVGSSSSDWGYKVYNSQKNGNPVSSSGTVFNGWKFMGGDPDVTLYWTGKNGTGWETAGNWAEMSGSDYRESLYTPTYNATVIIPAKQTITVSGTNYPVQYPVLTGNVKAKSIEIKKGSADNTNGELDLSDYTINAGASKKTKIENFGTLKLKGSAGQKTWFEALNADEKINLKEGCIVEYNGNPSGASNVWSGPYQKLKVSGTRQTLNASSMDVKRDLIIARTPVEISTGTGNQIYYGNVIANEGASNYDLTLTGGTITTSNTVTAGNLTVIGNWISNKVEAMGDIKVNDTLHSSSKTWTTDDDILVKGNLTAGQFNQTGGTLTFNGSGTEQILLFKEPFGQKNINNLTINTGAKVKLGSNVTIAGNFTNNGTFDATNTGSPPTGYTVTLTNGTNHTITGTGTAGNTKFHNLSLTSGGGKTLKIDGKITVSGDLKLEGTNDGSLLTVEGGTNPSEITLNGHKTGGKWLKVKNDIPITNGGSYIAAASMPDSVSTLPRNWIFTNAQGQIVWTGRYSDDWGTQRNWDPSYATPSEHADVIIKPGQDGRYPRVGTDAKAKSVTVENNAKLDLGEWTIKTSGGSTAKLDVKTGGHLFLKGSADQKAWFEQGTPANKMTVQSGSTVEYNGNTSVASNVWEGPYHKLIVSGDKTSLAASGMTVNDTFTINTTRAVTVTAPIQTYKKAVTLEADTTFNASTSVTFEKKITGTKKLTLSQNGTVNIKDDIDLTGNGGIIEQTGTGNVTIGISAGTPRTIKALKQTYTGKTVLSVNTSFEASETLLFKGELAAAGKDITLKGGDVTTVGQVQAQNLTANIPPKKKFVIKGAVKLSNTFKQTGDQTLIQIGAPVTDALGGNLIGGKFIIGSKYIYITDNAASDFFNADNIWWSTGVHDTVPDDCTFFIAKNLTLTRELGCGNFVLLTGQTALNMSTGNAISTVGDIVLFGSGYKADDTTAAGITEPSGIPGLFTYVNSGRTRANDPGNTADVSVSAPAGGTETDLKKLFTQLPDGTALPGGLSGGKYSGSFAGLGGKTLKAGKNFYANGIELKAETGSNPSWTLDIPANGKATDSFAEAYFTKVKNCTVTGGSVAAAEGCTDQTGNSGWDFNRPTIITAYTVSDDTIYVEFSEPIENSNNEIQKAVQYIKFGNGSYSFTKAYKDSGCTISTNGQGDLNQFYIRVESGTQRWNTDAKGTSAGSDDSTCRGGYDGSPPRHWNNHADLSIPKALNGLYASLRDEHKNRIHHYYNTDTNNATGTDPAGTLNGKRYGKVEDRCPPVLVAVYTGQEQHVQGGTQHAYDAHNFIEFRYSEPVFIGSGASAIPKTQENLRAETLGHIANSSSGITVASFASFAGGSIDVGNFTFSVPTDQDKVHALYRKFSTTAGSVPLSSVPSEAAQECRIRVSIAGYYDSTNKWIGYIKSAQTPSGPVTVLSGADIRTRDVFPSDPSLKSWEKLDTSFTPGLYSSSSDSDTLSVAYHPLASSWDTSPPVFAVFAENQTGWNNGNPDKEIVAYSASSHFADKIEFHFFDNTPLYNNSEPWWQTASATAQNPGWSTASDRYDSYGGPRFTRTMGGIRACTLPAPGEVKDVFIFDA
ncbi:MAG: hypothetical protein ACTTHA_05950, partial [Treponema sp.]